MKLVKGNKPMDYQKLFQSTMRELNPQTQNDADNLHQVRDI